MLNRVFRIVLLLFLAMILMYCIIVPENVMFKYYDYKTQNDSIINNVTKLCLNDDKIISVYCVNHYVYENFKYKESNKYIYPNELINKDGGDCKAWTFFYVKVLNELGINTKMIALDNHILLMAYEEDKFNCILDQTVVKCY